MYTPSRWLYALPAALAAYAVVGRSWFAAAWALLTFVQVWLPRRQRTLLTPANLVVGGTVRRRAVPWEQVRAVRAAPAGRHVTALLADGSDVRLPGVVWRAVRPEGQAAEGSAQAVAEFARTHGHPVALIGS